MMDFQPLTPEEQFIFEAYFKSWKYQCDDWSVPDGNSCGVPLSWSIRDCNSIMIRPKHYLHSGAKHYKSFCSGYDRAYETADYSQLT